jgi:hypothetical protein
MGSGPYLLNQGLARDLPFLMLSVWSEDEVLIRCGVCGFSPGSSMKMASLEKM